MPDDILKDAIETSRRILEGISDFETQGNKFLINLFIIFIINNKY